MIRESFFFLCQIGARFLKRLFIFWMGSYYLSMAAKKTPMDSLFTRLYKYRQTEKGNSKENYLTEILAFLLRTNQDFRQNLLQAIGCINFFEEFIVESQVRDEEFGIPDVVIKIGDHTIVVIEVKNDSLEGNEQLLRYSKYLLQSGRADKFLVYLTKHAGEPTLNKDGFKFSHLRWYSIFRMLKTSHDIFSIEFKKFLTEEKMTRKIELSADQKSAIKQYLDFWRSVKDFLEDLKDNLKRNDIIEFAESIKHDTGEIGVNIKKWAVPIWVGFYQGDHSEIKFGVSVDNVSSEIDGLSELERKLDEIGFDYYSHGKSNKYKTFFTQHSYSNFVKDGKFNDSEALDILIKDVLALKSALN